MTKEIIEKLATAFIEQIREKAKNTSSENLDLIMKEMEKNPDEFFYNDIKIMYKIFKKELESRQKQQ